MSWTLAGVFILILVALALRMKGQLRLARLRLALVERRERDLLDGLLRLTEASRESSAAVLSEFERTIRAASPSIDTVMVFEADGDELVAVRVSGERAANYEHVRFRINESATPLSRAALDGHRARLAPGMLPLVPTDHTAIAVPLCRQPQLSIAYLSGCKSSTIENEDTIVRIVESAAAPFALAREREADHEKATYDGLTGLLSARAFRTRLADEISLARIAAATVSLWFVDTDNFKKINDTYGHGAGDIVLQQMAQILSAHATPAMDVVARNGGDEFCAIVKNVPKGVAITRAKRLCDAVAGFDFGTDVRISASIGVATFPIDAHSAHELLEMADAAMYNSKRSGRNSVSFMAEGSCHVVTRGSFPNTESA